MPLSRAAAACPDEDKQTAAFRACPALEAAPFEALIPHAMWAANLLAKTLSVCWEWAFLALLTAVSGLIPQDRLEPTPSVSIPSSLWVILVQPGSTNSSGVTRIVSDALRLVFDRLWVLEKRLARQDAENPDEVVEPPRRQLLAGGGSLAATGLQMSLKQNRCAAVCIEPEVDQLLSWFTAESSIDKAAPAKLWDGATWFRPVMDKTRAFEVVNPWFGCLCGGHVPELFHATLKDTFGLRQRVTAVFGHPLWLSIQEIRAACEELPVPSRKPQHFVAGLVFPALRWSVKRTGMTFRASNADGASTLADRNFNQHVEAQKDAFLQYGRQDEAKYHGKLRTKFDRLVLALHVLNALCAAWRSQPDQSDISSDWGLDFAASEEIQHSVVKAAYAFCDHAESIWQLLDFARAGHTLPNIPDPAAPTQNTQTNRNQPPPPAAPAGPSLRSLADTMKDGKEGPSLGDMEKIMASATLPSILLTFLSNLPDGLSLTTILDVARFILQKVVSGVFKQKPLMALLSMSWGKLVPAQTQSSRRLFQVLINLTVSVLR